MCSATARAPILNRLFFKKSRKQVGAGGGLRDEHGAEHRAEGDPAPPRLQEEVQRQGSLRDTLPFLALLLPFRQRPMPFLVLLQKGTEVYPPTRRALIPFLI